MRAFPKPSEIRQKILGVKITKDGRVICNLKTAAGRAEYTRLIDLMYLRQRGICSLGNHWMPRSEATFEHTDLRSGGRRNDVLEYDKPNGEHVVNTTACGFHNGQKGSNRNYRLKTHEDLATPRGGE
jgi:hypothetical protein